MKAEICNELDAELYRSLYGHLLVVPSVFAKHKTPADVPSEFSGWSLIETYNMYYFFVEGMQQSVDGRFASMEFTTYGEESVVYVGWYKNGYIHNVSGPSMLGFNTSVIITAAYHINGKQFSKQDWLNHPDVVKTKLQTVMDYNNPCR